MCALNVFSVRKLKYAIRRVKNSITYVAYSTLFLYLMVYVNVCAIASLQVI